MGQEWGQNVKGCFVICIASAYSIVCNTCPEIWNKYIFLKKKKNHGFDYTESNFKKKNKSKI